MNAFPAYRPADTAPPIPAHLLLGIIHANLAFAIPKLSGHPMALAALDSALDMIREHNPMLEQAMVPELRPAHMVDVLPVGEVL